MPKLIVFAIVSTGFVFLSRKSLRKPHSHGFFRLFAFESILASILLNLEHWFEDPFSVPQILSWVLLLSSLVLAVHGFYSLRAMERPRSAIENTSTLVRRRAYEYPLWPLRFTARARVGSVP